MSHINNIEFSIATTDSIVKYGWVQVLNPETMKKGEPIPGGLNDAHLGTISSNYNCQTCLRGNDQCYGHEGYFKLSYPIFSPIFFQYMKNWLKIVCHKCGNCLLKPEEYSEFTPKSRFSSVIKTFKTHKKECHVCRTPVKAVSVAEDNQYLLYYRRDDKTGAKLKAKDINKDDKLYPHIIEQILNRIPNTCVESMGVSLKSHPKGTVLRAIRIPPSTIRPDIKKTKTGRSGLDDLTAGLRNVLKENDKLPKTNIVEVTSDMETIIYEMIDKFSAFIKGTKNKQTGKFRNLNSIAQDLKGKSGFFRKYLQGKRVRSIARSVITNDPSLYLDQLGVNIKFAKILQVEEVVQEWNYERLMVNFTNGVDRYPGCTRVITPEGNEYSVGRNHNLELKIGYRVYRDLEDGDYVLFNRQPSLLPSACTALRVKICYDDTLSFRMNVLICILFNADFDGDQMNIFALRTLAGRKEIESLSNINQWFFKHAYASPMIGQIDDSIIGTFCLTRSDVVFDNFHARLLFKNTRGNYILAEDSYTGRDIISILLRETPVSFTSKTSFFNESFVGLIDYDPTEIEVVIKNGKHIKGILDKKTIAKGAVGGLYHVVANEYGIDKALNLIFNMQQIAINYMAQRGFSLGIMDITIDNDTKRKIREISATIVKKAELIATQLNRGELIPPIGKTMKEYFESLMINALKVMDDFAEPILKAIDFNSNGLWQLFASGSKGTPNHGYHILASIGQIVINTRRPPEKFDVGRTLAYFTRFDTSPKAHGFIESSYGITGMDNAEFAFNAQNARFDLTSKALSTSETGYVERKAIKNLESIIINNLRFVIKDEKIAQLLYGGDGFDSRYIMKIVIDTIFMNTELLEKTYKYTSAAKKNQAIFDDEFAAIRSDYEIYRKFILAKEKINPKDQASNVVMLPMDLEAVIDAAKFEYREASGKDIPEANEEELAEMVKYVADVCQRIPYWYTNDYLEKNRGIIFDYHRWGSFIFTMYFRINFAATRHLRQMNMQMLEMLVEKIKNKFIAALVEPGTAVGIIAAMAFSEPLTQYMLDAHHRTTTGGTSKSLLGPVYDDFNAKKTRKLSSPSMQLFLIDEYNNEEKAAEVANYITMMKFDDFIDVAQIFDEKFGEPVHLSYVGEKKMIADFQKFHPNIKPPGDLMRYCYRFEINKMQLIYKNMSLLEIITKLREEYPNIYFVHTPENVDKIIIRGYLSNSYFKNKKKQMSLEILEEIRDKLRETLIRGVPYIVSATPMKISQTKVDESGALRKVERYVIKTEGTNFAGIMRIAAISQTEILTNAVDEVQNLIGIEAARQVLAGNITNMGAGGLNYHHVDIFVNEMTSIGKFTSIEHRGVAARGGNNIMLSAGFSWPVQVLQTAAEKAAKEKVLGVTSPILLGDVPQTIGTALNSFEINEEFVAENAVKVSEVLDTLGDL